MEGTAPSEPWVGIGSRIHVAMISRAGLLDCGTLRCSKDAEQAQRGSAPGVVFVFWRLQLTWLVWDHFPVAHTEIRPPGELSVPGLRLRLSHNGALLLCSRLYLFWSPAVRGGWLETGIVT